MERRRSITPARLRTIARQLYIAREKDKLLERQRQGEQVDLGDKPGDSLWNNDRDAESLIRHIKGLKYVFDYVRDTFPTTPQRVLFVGESTGSGVAELRQRKIAGGLDLFATTLRRTPTIVENVGDDHLFHTSAEQMRGVPPHSMVAVISVYGISYSVDPELAIRGIDYALAEGGIFKATFLDDKHLGSHGAKEFVKELQRIGGYGIYSSGGWREQVVAIKDGTASQAEEIGRNDHISFLYSEHPWEQLE